MILTSNRGVGEWDQVYCLDTHPPITRAIGRLYRGDRSLDKSVAAPGPAATPRAEETHPSVFSPATFAGLVILSVFGAVIGMQLLVTLGVTPNTSIIGALVAMIVARVPLHLFAQFRSVHVQNLAQSA